MVFGCKDLLWVVGALIYSHKVLLAYDLFSGFRQNLELERVIPGRELDGVQVAAAVVPSQFQAPADFQVTPKSFF